MKKNIRRYISAVLTAVLLAGSLFGRGVYVRAADAEYIMQLRAEGFPDSYIVSLAELHDVYPAWQFVPVHTGLEWDEVMEMEGRNGWNLVSKSGDDAKKSTAEGAYDWYKNSWTIYDGSNWVGAHPDYLAYCMDPRNFLDEANIYQFESLSYSDTQTLEGVRAILSGTFMADGMIEAEIVEDIVPAEPDSEEEPQGAEQETEDTASGTETVTTTKMISYAEAFVKIGRETGVSPYHLASRVRQEQGVNGTSSLISGTYKGYEGYYNYFNFGAYGATNTLVIQNGLAYAKKSGWDTRYKAILGGAALLAKNYIGVGQDTLYFQKFNVVNEKNLYNHQYMTNVTAAITEGKKMGEGYSDKQQVFVFRIPVYLNMPECAAAFTATGNPNNYLKTLEVADCSLTPTFDGATEHYSVFVESNVETVRISAVPVASTSIVLGTGDISLREGINTIEVACVSESGNPKNYTLTVVRQESPVQPPMLSSPSFQIGKEYITGLAAEMAASIFLENINAENGTVKLIGTDGQEAEGELATGQRLELYDREGTLAKSYEIVIYGDVNGDGKINVLDMIKVNRHILGLSGLSGCYLDAADANRAGDGVNVLDMIFINRHALGLTTIRQDQMIQEE